MTASVIVPSFMGAAKLPALLEAFRAQHTDPGLTWELLVVLDGVADRSPEIMEAYATRLPLRIVALDRNCGRSAALNAGFSAARGDVLIRCDDDLLPKSDFVARHVAHHLGQRVGVVGLCPNAQTGTPYDVAYGRSAARKSLSAAYELPRERRWSLWAANCSVTGETFDLVGPYDERFRDYGWEDIDWGFRLGLAGVPIVLDSALEAVHRGVPRSAAERMARAFQSGRARAAFEAKHGPQLADPRPVGVSQRIWAVAVSQAARPSRQPSYGRLGRVIDQGLPRIPSGIGRRLVAFGVEAAGLAGFRQYPNREERDRHK